MPTRKPRILFIDDNVRDIGGHYLELASLLADGAKDLGYEPVLATHASLPTRNPDLTKDARLADLAIDPCFDVRRMETWSLGVDGASIVRRDGDGVPQSDQMIQRWRQVARDALSRRHRKPSAMLSAWKSGFTTALKRFRPRPHDVVVVNTGGDFQLLALVDALNDLPVTEDDTALTIHVVFHFAVFDRAIDDRALAFGAQVNRAIHQIDGHQIHLHATTESLNRQLAAVGVSSTAIPYPTRFREPARAKTKNATHATDNASPLKLLLAGMPRAEKGRGEIKRLLASIEQPHLRSGLFQWSMQLPSKRWKRMIPESLQSCCLPHQSNAIDGPMEILRGNLTSQAYHDWLDTADVGLFLYDSDRYVARCSGVLLEMMIRGVPVIVPEGCWLADQVRSVGESKPIGWIYRSADSIPEILARIPEEIEHARLNCRRHADVIAERHSGRASLTGMGIMHADSVPMDAAA